MQPPQPALSGLVCVRVQKKYCSVFYYHMYITDFMHKGVEKICKSHLVAYLSLRISLFFSEVNEFLPRLTKEALKCVVCLINY